MKQTGWALVLVLSLLGYGVVRAEGPAPRRQGSLLPVLEGTPIAGGSEYTPLHPRV